MNRRIFLIYAGLSLALAACNPARRRAEDCDPETTDCADESPSRPARGPDIGAHEFGAESAAFSIHDVGAPRRP